MKWKIRQAAPQDIGLLQERFNLDLVSAKVLAGRGITKPDQVKFWLEEDISFLHNPFMFEDMQMFCDRVLQAIEDKEKVHVFGDRDVDGITSTALLVTELRRLGLEVTWSVPMGDDPYGISTQIIDSVVESGVTLAFTVDCGISCFDEVKYANSKGLDFLITDHHIAGSLLPPAVAVIDPKIEGCGYPFADLAGVGVTAKCIWALRLAITDYYNQSVILLHALPGNDTVIIEAAKIENLMVSDRISEEVVPGILPEENSRLLKFLNCNLPIFVLDEDVELTQLKKAFPKAEIAITDLRNKFEEYLPNIKNKSLFALNSVSRFALYSQTRSELDTLIGLFCAYVRASNPLLYREYADILDLVSIGTISDLMPMVGENRIMVRKGLKILEQSKRRSLVPFMALRNLLGHRLSTTDISWQISPYLNASGRLGQPDIAVNMLLAEEPKEANDYALKLLELNNTRQKLGEDAWTRIFPQAKKSFEQLGSKFVLVQDDKLPRGITGIIATRLQKNFRAPVMVITTAQDGRAMGSMRSQEGFNCHEFMTKYADLFDDFGGHACAGGFNLNPENIDELSLRIAEDVDYMDCPEEKIDELSVDAVLSQEQFNQNVIKLVEKFEPYGEQNEPLLFMIDGARIENLNVMSNSKDPSSSHIRMNLSLGASRIPAVLWNGAPRVGNDFDEGDVVSVVFRMGRNYYKNQESIQLTLIDVRRKP